MLGNEQGDGCDILFILRSQYHFKPLFAVTAFDPCILYNYIRFCKWITVHKD